ncbi:hypothetical protein ACFKHW_17330 [Bradyrhizobium lupini]|uniref:hypothetical protein n=1 Tax=Rhizobium lupini TaxID=136996 RepID=UPI0036719BF8
MTEKLPAPVAKPKPISKKIRAAIDAMVSGDAKTITDAAEKAGISREHLSRELGRPHIAKLLHDKTARNLSIHAAKAGATKVDLMSSAIDMVRDRASSFVLGLAGIAPDAAAGHQHRGGGSRAGYLIDLRDEQTVPGLVIVVHEKAPAPAAAGMVIDVTPNPSS